MEWACKVRAFDGEIIEDACRGMGGDSGSAMFLAEGKGFLQIIGIRSYGRRYAEDGTDIWQRAKMDPTFIVNSNRNGSVNVNHMRKELRAGDYRVFY
jgi:hypothetical protein